MKNIIDAMNWRYATTKFDTDKKLSDDQVSMLEESIRLAPSSYGLQPWKFIVVSNADVKMKLQEAGYNQAKIGDSSHLFVFAANAQLDEKSVETYLQSVSDIRGVPMENLKGYFDMINGAVSRMTPEQRTEWAARQAYIALGVLIAAGATESIDIAPMEGFDGKKFDEILGLDKLGFKTAVIAAAGFRSATDQNATFKKVRFSKEEVIIEVK